MAHVLNDSLFCARRHAHRNTPTTLATPPRARPRKRRPTHATVSCPPTESATSSRLAPVASPFAQRHVAADRGGQGWRGRARCTPGSRARARARVSPRLFVRQARDDKEGADFLMVKPGMMYLDIIRDIRNEVRKPRPLRQRHKRRKRIGHAQRLRPTFFPGAVPKQAAGRLPSLGRVRHAVACGAGWCSGPQVRLAGEGCLFFGGCTDGWSLFLACGRGMSLPWGDAPTAGLLPLLIPLVSSPDAQGGRARVDDILSSCRLRPDHLVLHAAYPGLAQGGQAVVKRQFHL